MKTTKLIEKVELNNEQENQRGYLKLDLNLDDSPLNPLYTFSQNNENKALGCQDVTLELAGPPTNELSNKIFEKKLGLLINIRLVQSGAELNKENIKREFVNFARYILEKYNDSDR